MAADYSALDKFSVDNNFTQVKFGASTKILEVELNEMQKIQSYKSSLLGSMLVSNGFYEKANMSVANGKLTVPADIIIYDGTAYNILEPMTISIASGNIISLAITTVEVDGDSTLTKSGNLSGGSSILNNIYDIRMSGLATAHRMQAQIKLVKDTGAADTVYLPVATMTSATAFSDNRVKCATAMPDLKKADKVTAPVNDNLLSMDSNGNLKNSGKKLADLATAAQGSKADAALPSATYTPADILNKIKTVHGSGSGLNADMLDGFHATTTSTANTIAVSDSNNNITASTFTGALAGNANTASKLQSAKTIALTGGATGSITFDGSNNASMAVTITNNSHTHTSSNITDASNSAGGIPLSNGTVNANLNADMLDGFHATTTSTAGTIAVSDSSNNITAAKFTGALAGNANTASKLQSAKTISLAGDATGSGAFDGSANLAITATLASSGVTAGTYKSVTVDVKGRVTAGTNPTTLSGYGITDGVNTSTYTAADILNKIKTVDGVGSGLDADLLGGKEVDYYAPIGSPVFIGTPTAPTPSTTDSSTRIATTNYVNNSLAAMSSDLVFSNSGTSFRGVSGTMADNDFWRIGGAGIASDDGYLEIATADNSNEPIYFRQYGGKFTNLTRTLTLLDGNGNTSIPGSLTTAGNLTVKGTINGNVNGNANTASKLQSAKTIALTGGATGSITFDGSDNASMVVTITNNSHTHTSSNITDANNSAGGIPLSNGTVNTNLNADMLDGYHATTTSTAGTIAVSDSSNNITAAKFTGALAGNANTASKLQSAKTIALTGGATGSITFDGSDNASMVVTIANNSHTHTSSNITDANNSAGGIPLSNGTVNTNLNADMLDGFHATTTSTAGTIAVSDSSNNITAAKFTGALAGNANTASTLQTARTINGVSFNGSASIVVADSTKLPLNGGVMTGAIYTPNNARGIYFGDDASLGDVNKGNMVGLWGMQDSKAGGIVFGDGLDTNLYRGAANQLKTDDSLVVTGSVGIGTTTPSAPLDVVGQINTSTGISVANKFTMQYNATEDSLDFIYG